MGRKSGHGKVDPLVHGRLALLTGAERAIKVCFRWWWWWGCFPSRGHVNACVCMAFCDPLPKPPLSLWSNHLNPHTHTSTRRCHTLDPTTSANGRYDHCALALGP